MSARGSRIRILALGAACGALLVTLPQALHAQSQDVYQISQRATISQMLGSTKVSLDYSRPLMRGRDDVFGKVIHWGELWTPGANEATVLELSTAVKLNGHDVAPGRWSMWVIPSRVGEWELVLDPRDSLFHTERPELTDAQVRFVVEPRHDAEYTEALTWTFPRVAQDGATLLMNWGSLEIPLDVAVESHEPPTLVAAEEAALYVGAWALEPAAEGGGPGFPPMTLTIRYGADRRLHTALPPFPAPPGAEHAPQKSLDEMTPLEREREEARRALAAYEGGGMAYVLVPRAQDVFVMGFIEGDVLLETGYVYHEFERENGAVVRLTIRDDKDRIMARGTRAK